MAGFHLELNEFEARYREYEKWNTLGAAHFLLSSAHKSARLSAQNTENYKMNDNATAKSPLANPWIQLIIGVICMACVANLQYGWTLFVNPIDAKYHAAWGLGKDTIKAIQWAFTLFVAVETFLVPIEGYLVDRYGPRV